MILSSEFELDLFGFVYFSEKQIYRFRWVSIDFISKIREYFFL